MAGAKRADFLRAFDQIPPAHDGGPAMTAAEWIAAARASGADAQAYRSRGKRYVSSGALPGDPILPNEIVGEVADLLEAENGIVEWEAQP